MIKSKSSARKAARSPVAELAAGLHIAVVELESAGQFRVRTLDGQRVGAVLDETVDRALAEECLRTGRRMLVANGPNGPTIFGAVQTARSVDVDFDGRASLQARDVRIVADERLTLEAGPVILRLEKNGHVRIDGTKMTIDVASLLKVLAAKVELP